MRHKDSYNFRPTNYYRSYFQLFSLFGPVLSLFANK